MRQAHHHSLSLTERGSDGTTIIPSSNKHITCDEVRRGDQCPEFFFVPNTYGKIILPIHFIHPSPKTSKNMHNNNGASSFFTFGEGSNAQKFFRKYLLPHLPSSSRTQIYKYDKEGRDPEPRTYFFTTLSLPPHPHILFLEHGIFFTRQRIEKN